MEFQRDLARGRERESLFRPIWLQFSETVFKLLSRGLARALTVIVITHAIPDEYRIPEFECNICISLPLSQTRVHYDLLSWVVNMLMSLWNWFDTTIYTMELVIYLAPLLRFFMPIQFDSIRFEARGDSRCRFLWWKLAVRSPSISGFLVQVCGSIVCPIIYGLIGRRTINAI